jgi:hypothetical protein
LSEIEHRKESGQWSVVGGQLLFVAEQLRSTTAH